MTSVRAVPACRICGNLTGNARHTAREMMFGYRDRFDYIECGVCGCLQLETVPDDLSKYYPAEYYSFERPKEGRVKRFLKRSRARHAMGRPNPLGSLLVSRYGTPPYIPWVRAANIGFEDPILDVGCGAGHLLLDMSHAGFTDLTGVDPYIDSDLVSREGVRVLKRRLAEVEGPFRLVLFNHSFEHLSNPFEALGDANRVLDSSGTVLIRIPVAGSHAWRKYGVDWVQLDAPRHIFLHTEQSLQLVARRTGFDITRVMWDSEAFQFWGSEQYARDIPLLDSRSYLKDPASSIFTPEEIREFGTEAMRRNESGEGDAASFFLRRSPGSKEV